MYRFLVVIEKANKNYSAYSPDLPGCVATGATREEAEKNMHEAIVMHIKGLREDGVPIPESSSFAVYVTIHYKFRNHILTYFPLPGGRVNNNPLPLNVALFLPSPLAGE